MEISSITYTARLVYTIIFNFDDNNYDKEEDNWTLGSNILNSLKNIVEYHVKHNEFSEDIKNNIFKFIEFVRSVEDEHFSDRVKICNEITRLLNSQKCDRSSSIYRTELFKRRMDTRYLFSASLKEINEERSSANSSIAQDSYILMCLSDDFTTDDEFYNEYIDEMCCNKYFYETINALLWETPVLFKNLTFYNRVLAVLNKNKELIKSEEIEEKNTKVIKRIKRRTKRLK